MQLREEKRAKQKSGKQLTSRDIEILNFINDFGFCEILHIEKRFNVRGSRSYQLMQRLIEMGLLKHERIFYKRHGIFRLSSKGADYTSLPPVDKIPVGIYDHQLSIVDVYLKLRKIYPEFEWISERQLQHEKFFDGVGKSGHLSDGILVLPGNKQIAIEVELRLKGKNRIERILKGYSSQFHFAEVWYFCLPNLLAPLTASAANLPFIKIQNIKEFLS